jgi:hypothetical protein
MILASMGHVGQRANSATYPQLKPRNSTLILTEIMIAGAEVGRWGGEVPDVADVAGVTEIAELQTLRGLLR